MKILLMTFGFFVKIAIGCLAPLPIQHESNEELINRTGQIYLAKVDSIKIIRKSIKERRRKKTDFCLYEYKFTVKEVLKGDSLKIFTILSDNNYADSNSFSNHFDSVFWEEADGRNWGRLSNWPDCEIHPGFIVGKNYLVFLTQSQLYHSKSFEQIDDIQCDKWYEYIKEKVKARAKESETLQMINEKKI